jgi:GntR family transcriptional regulator
MANWYSQGSKEGDQVLSPRSRVIAAGNVPERTDVYERLADELRQAILSGRYRPGDRLPSTQEIMRRTGVANLTVRGAYRLLVEEGLVESVSKKGFYVRRPSGMTWHMNTASGSRRAAAPLDGWLADAEAAGLTWREDISVAIEDASIPVLGVPAGERLGLPARSRVLVRRAVRYTGAADDDRPATADSLADEYYPYDLIRDTSLASPEPISSAEVLAEAGLKIRRNVDELRPRIATSEERRLLSLPQVSVVLELARTAYTADRQPAVVLHQIRRGDGATYQYDI